MSLWSEQQREWLQALGHDVLMLAPAPGAQSMVREPSIVDTAAPMASEAPAHRAPRAGTDGATGHDALLRALARAAGRQPQDDEFLRALPDLASLRGNPAARRALWPRLRALRRRRPG